MLLTNVRKQFECEFEFDEQWDGLELSAVFVGSGSYQCPIVDGSCIVPAEIQRGKYFSLGVVGVAEDKTYVTNLAMVLMAEGVPMVDLENSVPTPSVWESYMATITANLTAAQAACLEAQVAAEVAKSSVEGLDVYVENASLAATKAENAQDQAEIYAKMAEISSAQNPYIGENGNWHIWSLDLGTFADSGIAAQGETGEQGVAGDQGIQGETGAKGDKGDTGEQGVQGDKGDTGEQGIQGETGATGEKGDTGEQGVAGVDGADGLDGTDGVGISGVVKTGTVGLVDTYIISFTDGSSTTFAVSNGADGVDGVDGTNGVDGATGATGEQGVAGVDGVDGYTPVKGVDYFDGVDGTNGINGIDGIDGIDGVDGQDGLTTSITLNDTTYTVDDSGNIDLGEISGGAASVFDLVIRTQAEFEAMYASSTWLDAKSVCFIGDGGSLEFTRSDGSGLKIPQTVMNLQGLNGAKINVTNFSYNESTNKAALWYATQPEVGTGYWIDGLEVECAGIGQGYGFYSCTQLTNCTGTGTGSGYGLYNCTQLTNCTGNGTGSFGGWGYGFYGCIQLTNCTGTGTNSSSSGQGYGFHSCTQLTNCTGTGTGTGDGQGNGFYNCTQLTNCTGTGTGTGEVGGYGYGFRGCIQLTNCTGTGTGTGEVGGWGYGFYSCSWVNGCKQGSASTTAFTGGTMTNVDTATVVAV